MNPAVGFENRNDSTYIMGKVANPYTVKTDATGNKSLPDDQPSCLHAANVIITMNVVNINVIKSNKNDAIQKVHTFNPLTICNSFDLETLSLIWKIM